ncbi:MAG: cupin domain-containing protein [Alphaproteobacteria bacterium]|nr:cupin domain-containing protein [Alphaproteobacteria bacterium]
MPVDKTKAQWVEVLRRTGMTVGLYAPGDIDKQGPHGRDELYFVVSGNGTFRRDDQHRRFGPGDMLYVPAGMRHAFEHYSDDLMLWVVFCDGGEPLDDDMPASSM